MSNDINLLRQVLSVEGVSTYLNDDSGNKLMNAEGVITSGADCLYSFTLNTFYYG